MPVFFDTLIAIGIIGTALPALILLYHQFKDKKSWEYKNRKSSSFLAAILLLGSMVFVYGSFIESRLIVLTKQTIDLPNIENEIKAVVVADYQVGPYKKTGFVERSVTKILNLNPDVVFIVGDQVDNGGSVEDETKYLEPLKKITEAGIPTFAIHGNHEYGIGGGRSISEPRFRLPNVSKEVKDYIESLGIRYLVNETEFVKIHEQGFYLFGGDSFWAGNLKYDSIKDNKDITAPVIALIHNPAAAWDASKEAIDLMIAGHTHGGQIRLPFIGPIGKVDKVTPTKWYQGLNKVAEMQLYVTSGIGETGARARLFNPPEIVLLNIE